METIEIMLPDFEEVFGELITFFNARLSPEITRKYYQRVRTYPLDAFRFAVEEIITKKRPVASNFPMVGEITQFCCRWLDNHPDEKHKRTQYHEHEDSRYPTSKLWKAFEILTHIGEDAFNSYVKAQRMPTKDIERVRNKARIVQGGEDPIKQVENITQSVGDDIPF